MTLRYLAINKKRTTLCTEVWVLKLAIVLAPVLLNLQTTIG